jgi:hypothetical protein
VNARGFFLAQAVRGPIMLITIGALFAMHQAGILSFARTWPLILIVLGVMKLIERMAAPRVPYAPPYTPPYGPPYGQPPYSQPPYGQPPYGPPPSGQPPYPQPPPPAQGGPRP